MKVRLWVHLQDGEERHWVGFNRKGEVVEALVWVIKKEGKKKKEKKKRERGRILKLRVKNF